MTREDEIRQTAKQLQESGCDNLAEDLLWLLDECDKWQAAAEFRADGIGELVEKQMELEGELARVRRDRHPMGPEELKAIAATFDAADQMVHALNNEGRMWTLRIPANADDPDIVLIAAVMAGRKLLRLAGAVGPAEAHPNE